MRAEGLVQRVLGLALALAVVMGPPARAADDPKPALTIVLESESILAAHAIGAHAWIENPTNDEITGLKLSLRGPEKLHLGRGDPAHCTPAPGGVIDIRGRLAPHSALDPPVDLCIKADSYVDEKDVNVAFDLTWQAPGAKPAHNGMAVVEKKVSVGLISTDTVAGVSLRLIGFFLPGALGLMLLTLAKFPYAAEVSGANGPVVAVIASLLLSLLVSWLAGPQVLGWQASDGGSSVLGLIAVSGLAVVIAGVMIGIHQYVLMRGREAKAARLVGEEDLEPQMLVKALKESGKNLHPVRVQTRNATYIGSAVADTETGGLVVMGWYQVAAADPAARAKVEALLAKGRVAEALDLPGVTLEVANNVRSLQGGQVQGTDAAFVRIWARDKPEFWRGPVDGLDVKDPPLMLG